ncbi:uncharacterized protein [Miscanthus floridulus]|uniref:uncharacterized protein n=1 Tax=Miscanthus floridulus TaxID=154761 RepID=UPI003457670A
MIISKRISGDQKTKQPLSLSNAQQLWDEWELQCLVVASFALQAFFLCAASIRRRNASTVLRVLLWLAYLLADYVAVYVLGHLTLKIGEPRHELVLLWAPVLLLHLGGQETITAFSMQDNELWKRHLLGLVTQVVLAVYVVAKSPSWRRGNEELLAPVVLMFVSGTIKYAERTWALKTATSETIKRSRMGDLCKTMSRYQAGDRSKASIDRYNKDIVGRRKWWLEEEYADLVEAAGDSFPNCINALMDIPVAPWLLPQIWPIIEEMKESGEKEWFPSRAYKMGEIQLSLMYDHLYTKVGLRYAHAQRRLPAVVFTTLGLPLLTLATTSSALVLFATTTTRSKGGVSYYSAADVAVSYILLAGAVALEVLSILTFVLSFRSYCFLRVKLGAGSRLTRAVFWSLKSVRPYHKPLWSNKWAQYNLVAGCIREKQAGCLARMMRHVGLLGDTKLRPISDRTKELICRVTKELICNELNDWTRIQQFSHVRGQGILSLRGLAKDSDLYESIDKVDFSTSVVMWHLITHMCSLLAASNKDGGGGDSRDDHMLLAMEVSNYLMDLVLERRVLISSEGHVAHRKAREEVKQILAEHGKTKQVDADDAEAVREVLEAVVSKIRDPAERDAVPAEGAYGQFARDQYETIRPVLPRALRLARMLLSGQDDPGTGGDRVWELIASVWIEMLFHLATRCEAGFHAKNLCTGGEFITHVRFLLLNRGIGWNFVLGRA